MQGSKFKRQTGQGKTNNGGNSPLRRTSTLAKKAEDTNPYVEKPRASLYNVIMRLRENAMGFRHCLVIIKIADFESKKDCEPAITDLFNNMTDDNGHCFKDMATGLCCILGNYALQLLQIEDDLFMRFVL